MEGKKTQLKEEQLQVINHNEGDLIVSASAGSGKTFVMIERLIRLICEKKADVSEILAVTYTESAAAEMKAKLKAALEKRLKEEPDAFLTEQFNKIAYSDISTVDSFCSRLIRRYFFTIGCAPDYRIADDKIAAPLKALAIDKTFREFYEKKDPEFLKVVERHASARSDEGLKGLVLGIYNFCSTEADPEKLLNASDKYYTEEGCRELSDNLLIGYMQKFDGFYNDFKSAKDKFSSWGLKKGEAFCDAYLGLIESLKGCKDLSKMVEIFDGFYYKTAFESKLTGDARDLQESVKKKKAALLKINEKIAVQSNLISDFKENYAEYYKHTKVIAELVKSFNANFSAAKREENLLDFADIERFALEILKDESAREEIKNKYKYVFIDEYQDVNGLQEEILNHIKKDNLFMVGDVKQSIYGFRGCRYEFFAEKYKKMSCEKDQAITLNYNFRSASAVIDLVNEIFSFSMKKELFGEDYSKSSKLISGGIYPDGAVGRAQIHMYCTKEKRNTAAEEPRIYDILEEIRGEEEDEISKSAALIVKIIEEELEKNYYDPKEKKFKPVTKKDITVLSRNAKTSYVSSIVKGLIRRNIDVVSPIAEQVVNYPEVKTLIAFLKLLDCYSDDVSLATVMKSPIGNFTDEDFASICFLYSDEVKDRPRNWGFVDAYFYALNNASEELIKRLSEFDGYIKKMRFLSDFKSAHDILDKLNSDKHLEEFYFADKGGEMKVGRMRAFIAASISGDKYYTVKEFIEYVKADGEDITFEFTGGEDAVKVMTIHASKGLEFPVVIVCGLEKKENDKDAKGQVITDRKYGLAVKKFDEEKMTVGDTLLTYAVKERFAENLIKEELMLFYVALTRATYSLHLTYKAAKDNRTDEFTGAEKYWHYIPKSLPVIEHTDEEFCLINTPKSVRKVLISKQDEEVKKIMDKNYSFSYPFIADTTLPLKSSVSEILSERNDNTPVLSMFDEESAVSTDKERGIIAHKFMEYYDIVSLPSVYDSAKELVKRGVLTEKDLEKIDLFKIERCIKSGAFDGAAKMNDYREKAFIVNLPAKDVLGSESAGKVLIQGVIDLLLTDGKTAKIIDYKYSKKSTEGLYKTYKDQLRIYALATEKILNVKVTEKVILNLVSGESVVID